MAGQKLDERPYLTRPSAWLLYDFYFDKASQLEELNNRAFGQSDETDQRRREALEELFADKPRPTILELVEERKDAGGWNTGDPILDRYYAMLDRGEVPEHFWGPDGPPKE